MKEEGGWDQNCGRSVETKGTASATFGDGATRTWHALGVGRENLRGTAKFVGSARASVQR